MVCVGLSKKKNYSLCVCLSVVIKEHCTHWCVFNRQQRGFVSQIGDSIYRQCELAGSTHFGLGLLLGFVDNNTKIYQIIILSERWHQFWQWGPDRIISNEMLCASRCYQMDDYSPAKNLMTMCFTYYYTGISASVRLLLTPCTCQACHSR